MHRDLAADFKNPVFQRLMEYERWQEMLREKMDLVVTRGFPYLIAELNRTYAHIQNDVRHDPEKKGTYEDFETSVDQLHSFLKARPAYLHSWKGYARPRLHEVSVSNSFPTADDPEVTVNVRMEQQ